MSPRVTVALLWLFAAPGLAAQDSALRALREEVARREAVLRAATSAEEAAAARARATRRPADLLVVPPVTVMVPGGEGPAMRPEVARAAERIQATWGDIGWLLADQPVHAASHADLRITIETLVGARVAERAGRRLRAWALNGVPRTGPALWAAAYVDLATAAPGAATRCLRGDRASCVLALGLAHPPDPATAYWDSAGRHETIRRWNLRARRRTGERAVRCLDTHDDAACRSLLRELQAAGSPVATAALAPIGRDGRLALVATAMALGAPDAVRRLVADTAAPPGARIAAAAGVPLDSVVAVWHATLLAHRPVHGLTVKMRLMTVAWILVCAGLALGGTRWRAG